VIVAGVWAVAATAVAIIALLDQSNTDANRRSGDAARSVSRLEHQLDSRIDALESQVKGLPTSNDLQSLQQRVATAEDKATQASDDAKAARNSIKDLENRVKTLEQSSSSTGGNTPGGTSQP
jgi:predicted  nucleic acid-binding Zn-ribbon protein